MVFGNIHNLEEYPFLEQRVLACFSYAAGHDLGAWEKGSYEIDGQDLFVNIVQYETTAPENRFWEAHRAYLDLHLMLDGVEQVDLNFIENMEQIGYTQEDDFLRLDGEKNSSAVLRQGIS